MQCDQYSIINSHCKAIKHILIIEDSVSLGNHLKEMIDEYFSFRCDIATTEAQANEMIRRKRYDLIITDVYLPDSSGNFLGELVRNDLRLIVMTASDNDELRSSILTLPIIDYVLKSDAKTLVDYLVNTIQRLNSNRDTVIGICDDSKISRHLMAELVKSQNLPYIEFANGQEVYDFLVKKNCHMDVLVSDYEMPKMNGLELIRHLRHEYLTCELPIIAISSSDKPHLTVQFLKAGANDYIKKPFGNEELCTRLNLTLDQLYANRRNKALRIALEKAATHDFLTQLYNRNFFFTQIHHITADAIRQKKPYGILMIDIDHFKRINDTYGHHAGDTAIIHLASILKNTARTSDYCIRWGGEEFLILIPHVSTKELAQFAERLRTVVEKSPVCVVEEKLTFNITISIGGSVGLSENSQTMISQADALLYDAKNSGRNCVKI
ncbi:MAG: diguanylate cyclase [Sulfuricurvum sp.]|nr:diguanylate cyclase [Sulfuricurvum sp.]MDP3023448.1 diguanylate cyclase [Sulfuricurvum sp.]MDP3118797.1 diguanylate cyclase [Sulfuricurvum sp.]